MLMPTLGPRSFYGSILALFLVIFSIYFHGTTTRVTKQLWLLTNKSCITHNYAESSLQRNTTSSSELFINHELIKVPVEERRIVFMAGPHKTGSTSIQVNLATWSLNELLGNWRWGINNTDCVFENISKLRQGRDPAKRKIELRFAKGYSPLMNLLAETGNSYPRNEKDQSALIQCYKNQLNALWQDGYNLVLGSEAADFGLRKKVDAQKFVHGILSIMPIVRKKDFSITERITFVVTYRYPRVDHYISYWHMAGNPPALREWTLETPYELHPLNPLGLAKFYLDFGFHVVILDSSGLYQERVDLSNAVACDILKVPCVNSQIMYNPHPPEIRNHGDDNDMNDLTNEELTLIDETLRDNDCNYRDLLFHPNVTIKYGHKLIQTIVNCSSNHRVKPWSEIVAEIKYIARMGSKNKTV